MALAFAHSHDVIRACLRLIAAGALAVMAIAASARSAEAATYTFSFAFEGTITSVGLPNTGLQVGQKISGNGRIITPTFTDTGSGAVHVPGLLHYGNAGGAYQNDGLSFSLHVFGDPSGELILSFYDVGPFLPVTGVPQDMATLAAMGSGATGYLVFGSPSFIAQFSIDSGSLRVTPIPAAFLLFASALSGLAFLGWHRHKSCASRAGCVGPNT